MSVRCPWMPTHLVVKDWLEIGSPASTVTMVELQEEELSEYDGFIIIR